MRTFPWAHGMVLANPAAILAAEALHANNSAPAGVNRTKVPLSCIASHPRSMHSFMPAPHTGVSRYAKADFRDGEFNVRFRW
jgi:hypothetical protein